MVHRGLQVRGEDSRKLEGSLYRLATSVAEAAVDKIAGEPMFCCCRATWRRLAVLAGREDEDGLIQRQLASWESLGGAVRGKLWRRQWRDAGAALRRARERLGWVLARRGEIRR